MPALAWLGFAIFCEVIAISSLKASDGFTRLLPSVVVVLGYGGALFTLSRALCEVPMGVAYAIWSGVGIVLITLVGWIWYGQKLSAVELFAISMIVVGAALLNLRH